MGGPIHLLISSAIVGLMVASCAPQGQSAPLHRIVPHHRTAPRLRPRLEPRCARLEVGGGLCVRQEKAVRREVENMGGVERLDLGFGGFPPELGLEVQLPILFI
jgi:hypothetical protein